MDIQINKNQNLFYKILPDILAVIFLISTGWKLLHAIGAKLDLPLNDEAFYIYRGLFFPAEGTTDINWGVLYSLWYRLLSLFSDNTVNLFYLNFIISAVLPPLAFYFMLRRNRLQALVAMIISWLLLISLGNLETIPRVTHPALVLLMLPFIITDPRTAVMRKGPVILVFWLSASYFRPEFMISVFLLIFYFFIHTARNFRLYKSLVLITGWVVILLCLATAELLFGLPLIHDSYNRGFFAFCQHFAFNYASWNPVITDSWQQAPVIVQTVFGNADSFADLLIANPLMLFKHIGYNILHSVQYFFGITFIHHNFFLTDSSRAHMIIEGCMVLALFLLWMSYKIWKGKSKLKENFSASSETFLIILIAVFPSILTSVLIYPRWHYLIVAVYLLMAMLSMLVFASATNKKSSWYLLLVGIVLFLLSGSYSDTWKVTSARISQTAIPMETKKVVEEVKMRSGNTQKNHTLLDAQNGLGIYLYPEYKPVYHFKTASDLAGFIASNGIDRVLVDPDFSNSQLYKMFKSEWDDFMIYPCKYGFNAKHLSIQGYALYEQDAAMYR